MTYPVKIYWKNGDTLTAWDEKCIQLMELFGLPGDKYVTTFCEDFLQINFYNERDAIHASLAL
jgi:hypothetical protein